MSGPLKTYVEGIHRELEYYPAWPPNAPLALGDIGVIKNGQFDQLTKLSKLGIGFQTTKGPQGSDLSITSGESVSVQLKASGETLEGTQIPKAKAGVLVEFSASGAFLFQVRDPVVHWIEDRAGLAQRILEKFRSRKPDGTREWHEDWCVVTELVIAESATILISTSKQGKVELSAQSAIPIGTAPLASAEVGLTVTKKIGEVLSYIAGEPNQPSAPLLRLMRVKQSFLQRILGGDDGADVVRAARAAPQGPGGLSRILLEEVSEQEMVPILDPEGKPTRAWEPAPKESTPGEKKRKPAPKKTKRGK